MHILWICGSCVVGGAERATLQVAASLRERGHRIAVICPPASRLHPELDRLQLAAQSAPLGGALNLRAYGAIAGALAAMRPDVALVTTADEWVWACLCRGAAPRTRLVLARHMALPLAWRVRWLAARRADAVVAVSRAVRDSLRLIPPGRVHVIYNPVRFPPRASVPSPAERADARRALGLPPDGRWVGFFGGLDPNKGVADVAHAVQRADHAVGPTRLLLCGRRRAGRQTAEAIVRELGSAVHDLGETDRVAEALTAVDVVVMATRRRLSEALPATLAEAMACGTPVLAYATGGMAEIIGDDGQAGRLATPDDRDDLARVLIEMLSDANAGDRMAAAGLVRAREVFDPQRAADGYERIFGAATAAHGNPYRPS